MADGSDIHAAAVAASVASTSLPPHDLQAERNTLGGILLFDGAAGRLAQVEPIITSADFYHPANGVIFDAMQAVVAARKALDVVTLSAELRARERLNTIGGPQYLGELTDTLPTAAHLEEHARIVADLALVRRIIAAAHEVTARGYGERGSAESFADFATARINKAAERRTQSQLVPLDQAIQEAFERIEVTINRGSRTTGVETGFHELDRLTAGMHPGQLIIVAGRPAMGKTSIVLNTAAHAARHGPLRKPVLFFSLEMPRVELANRMMCAEARVDQSRLRSNMLTQDDMTALTSAASKLFGLPIDIDDSGDLTLVDIKAKCRAKRAEHKDTGLGLVIIDYLQLMRASRERADNREREISEISRGLKALAKELDVPIVALSQLNRAPETRPGKDRRPQLSDLRESGAIEQDADVVEFIYRDEVYNRDTEDKGIAEVIVAKQRNGPTDTVRLRFVRELTKFENLAEDETDYQPAAHTIPASTNASAAEHEPPRDWNEPEERDDF